MPGGEIYWQPTRQMLRSSEYADIQAIIRLQHTPAKCQTFSEFLLLKFLSFSFYTQKSSAISTITIGIDSCVHHILL